MRTQSIVACRAGVPHVDFQTQDIAACQCCRLTSGRANGPKFAITVTVPNLDLLDDLGRLHIDGQRWVCLVSVVIGHGVAPLRGTGPTTRDGVNAI